MGELPNFLFYDKKPKATARMTTADSLIQQAAYDLYSSSMPIWWALRDSNPEPAD